MGKSPDDVKQTFENYGFPVLDCIGVPIRLSKKAQDAQSGVPRMYCYLEMRSLDDAVLGLAQLSTPIRELAEWTVAQPVSSLAECHAPFSIQT